MGNIMTKMSIGKDWKKEREMKSSEKTIVEEERKNEDSAVIVMERSNSSDEPYPSAPEHFLKQEEEKFGDLNKGMISQTISQVVDIPQNPNIIVPLETNKDNNTPLDIPAISREYTIPDEWIMDDTHKTHDILSISGIENDHGKVAPNFYPTKKVLSYPELLPELVITEDSCIMRAEYGWTLLY